MDDFEDFINNGHGSTDWLLETFEPERNGEGDIDMQMIREYVPGCVDITPKDPDTAMPTVEVQDSQDSSQWPTQQVSSPIQRSRDNSFSTPSNYKQTSPLCGSSSNSSVPIQRKPGHLDPHNTSTSNNFRLSFSNPSNASLLTSPQGSSSILMASSAPRSIFGPSKAQSEGQMKGEEANDRESLVSPETPHREGQPKTTATQPVPQPEETSFTSYNHFRTAPSQCPTIDDLDTEQASKDMDSDGDSDDQFEIIDASQASLLAQRNWSKGRPRMILSDEPQTPIIKSEPRNGDDSPVASRVQRTLPIRPPATVTSKSNNPDLAAIIASQQALLSKSNATPKVFFSGRQKPTEKVASLHTNAVKKRPFEVQDDPEQVEAAMRAGSHEDNSWMHEEPEDDIAAEIEIVRDKIEALARREKNGKINEIESVELRRLRKYLLLQEKMIRAAKGDPRRELQEESLFIPDDRDEMLSRKRSEHRQRATQDGTPDRDLEVKDDGDDSGDRGPESTPGSEEILSQMMQQEFDGDGLDGFPSEKGGKKTKKPRKKAATNAREFFYREEEERREKERNKTQKQKRKGGKGGRKAAARGKAAAGKKSKGAAKGGKGGNSGRPAAQFNKIDGVDEIGQMMINDLMNNDPITERLQNPIFDVEPEPEMGGRHVKATQLQHLLSNIPEGSNVKEARNDKARLKQASRSFGYAQVRAVDGKWLIKGMRSTLYHHQLLGAQWMIQRELSDETPYGGLLADSMGLGKTVQTLACMVGNPPDDKDRRRGIKATLIVVPSSVIDQWLDEVRTHTDSRVFPKVMHYKKSSKISVEVLRDLDIVVTSYQEVMRQFPFPDAEDREKIGQVGFKKWWKKAEKSMGDLFSVYWYRVVLDEAHAIKNNSARTSLACQNLRSIFRWCLTGTPLLNRLEELFPYLRFLKANYSMDWKTFQRYFCDPDANDCNTRIATLLSYTMMRRTMSTTILNRPIITLPKPHPEIRYVQFSAEERLIYRITENRFRANLNVFLANGTASKNYGVFLVQLLRLRQCTSHPFMLEQTMKHCWTSSDLKELKRLLKSVGKVNVPFYEQCKVWVTQTEEERQAAADRGEDPDLQGAEREETMPFGAGDFGHSFEMGKALKTLSEEDMYARVTCSICSDLPRLPMLTDCNHIFCKECLSNYMHTKVALNDNEDYMTCPTCDKIFSSFKPYTGLADNDGDGMESDSVRDGTPSSTQGSKSRKRKDRHSSGGKGADALGFEPKVADSTWVEKSDDDSFPLVPSAKTAALKAILLKGFREAPTDKVVIYVQFRVLAKIVGRICHSEQWDFVYLTGDCSLDHRSKAIKKFRDDDDVKILIAGLKCGGLGLNFPFANRCISLDLWWNHAVEQQAFGRIFRIGQKKDTYMTRLIVKDTVDMRLLNMQLHKLKACDTAMESGEKSKPSLNLKEMARLFGFLRTAEDGTILAIEPDYQDDD